MTHLEPNSTTNPGLPARVEAPILRATVCQNGCGEPADLPSAYCSRACRDISFARIDDLFWMQTK